MKKNRLVVGLILAAMICAACTGCKNNTPEPEETESQAEKEPMGKDKLTSGNAAPEESESDGTDNTIWNYLSEETISFFLTYDVSDVDHVEIREYGEGGEQIYATSEFDDIADVFMSIDAIKITGETDMTATDSDTVIYLEANDKVSTTVTFNAGNLSTQNGNYEIENASGLWSVIKDIKDSDDADDWDDWEDETEDPEEEAHETDRTPSSEDYKIASADDFSLEYPALSIAIEYDDMVAIYPKTVDDLPYYYVTPIDDMTGSIDEYLETAMANSKEYYSVRMVTQPELQELEIGGRKQKGYMIAYSSEDGSRTVTDWVVMENAPNGDVFYYQCSYISHSYNDGEYPDENTYFEFMHAIETMEWE